MNVETIRRRIRQYLTPFCPEMWTVSTLFSSNDNERAASSLLCQSECALDPTLAARHEAIALFWEQERQKLLASAEQVWSAHRREVASNAIFLGHHAAACRRAAEEGPTALNRIAVDAAILAANHDQPLSDGCKERYQRRQAAIDKAVEQETVLQLVEENPARALRFMHALMDSADVDRDEVLPFFERGEEDEIQALFERTVAQFFGC